jgi:hypothetical protein
MSLNRPWDFSEARANCHRASQRQEDAENALRKAYIDKAVAEESFRVALADRILELRDEGLPATVCSDVARGDRRVAELRRARDIAEGVCEALSQAAWRMTADRKDAQRFADWSQRRELAETGHVMGVAA